MIQTHDVETVTKMLCKQSPRQQLLDQEFGPDLTELKIAEFLKQEGMDDDEIAQAQAELADSTDTDK